MSKNLVFLLDGTANALTAHTTHLPRLYRVLEQSETQQVFYDPGVGTFEAGNSFLSGYRRFKELLGMATGWGLDRNVKQAYHHLCQVYTAPEDSKTPDRIFLIGFSRGAHTARVLAGMVHNIGLLKPDQMHLVDYAFDAYKGISDSRHDNASDTSARFEAVDAFTRHMKPRQVPIRCLALFDTVSSMIEFDGFRLRLRPYANTTKNTSVQSVRHAVAIDERRVMYVPRLWGTERQYWGGKWRPKEPDPQDVSEVWFSGVHADVGGGYPEKDAGLAKIPLDWMVKELTPMGLDFDPTAVKRYVKGSYEDKYVKPDPLAAPQDSMKGFWKLIEYLPFRYNSYSRTPRKTFLGWFIPKGARRHIEPKSNIHASVFKRRGTPHDYPQPNIPDDHTVI